MMGMMQKGARWLTPRTISRRVSGCVRSTRVQHLRRKSNRVHKTGGDGGSSGCSSPRVVSRAPRSLAVAESSVGPREKSMAFDKRFRQTLPPGVRSRRWAASSKIVVRVRIARSQLPPSCLAWLGLA